MWGITWGVPVNFVPCLTARVPGRGENHRACDQHTERGFASSRHSGRPCARALLSDLCQGTSVSGKMESSK